MRRWMRQGDVDDGIEDGQTSTEQSELVTSPRPSLSSGTRYGSIWSGRNVRRASLRCTRSGAGKPPASSRRTYILTTADTLVPPEAQRVVAASVGADIVEIAADQGNFREQPARLAELLVVASN